MLILGEASEELSRNIQSCWSMMTSLGFVVNSKKSIPALTQEIEFLGFVVNLRSMTLAVTKKKLKSLTSQCKNLLQSVYNSPPSGSGDWHHDFPEPNSSSSTLVLLGLTRAQKGISGPLPLIQFSDLAESESDDRSEVVDRSWESVEIQTDSHQPTSTNNRVGHLTWDSLLVP